jgi:hypothetical protein
VLYESFRNEYGKIVEGIGKYMGQICAESALSTVRKCRAFLRLLLMQKKMQFRMKNLYDGMKIEKLCGKIFYIKMLSGVFDEFSFGIFL